MVLLLRRPIRRHRFGVAPKRVGHHYRLLDLVTNQCIAVTYRGTPKNNYSYHFTYSVRRALIEGWLPYKPAIGLPIGV